jgi:hypothetical protein
MNIIKRGWDASLPRFRRQFLASFNMPDRAIKPFVMNLFG